MFLHFYYANIKKEKINYIFVFKHEDKIVKFNKINKLLYNKLNSLIVNDELDNENENENSINFYELFYFKEGVKITYEKIIWDDLIKIYLSKVDILSLIDEKYVKELYLSGSLLFPIIDYENNIKQFLIKYYENQNY
jgi:hypothetical protein